MPVLHLRSPITVAAALLVAAVLVVWAAYDLETQVDIQRTELFTLAWGEGPGQVGQVQVDGRTFGPRSFAVSGDRVVVADTFHDRLLVLDRRGELVSLFPLAAPAGDGAGAAVDGTVLPVSGRQLEAAAEAGSDPGPEDQSGAGPSTLWVNDVALGPAGRFYLADAAAPRVVVLAPDGTPAEVIDITPAAPGEDPAGDAVWLLERIAVDEDGLLYLTHAYLSDALLARRVTRLGPADSKFAQVSAAALREGGAAAGEEGLLPVPANSFAVGLDGRLYVESAGSSLFARQVRSYDRDARPGPSWEVIRAEPVVRAEVLGASPDGWVFVAVNPGRPQGRVVVLAPGREQETYEVDPGWTAGYEANVHARLAGDGLYVARAGDEGWSLDHWQIQRRRWLRPVWR